MNKVGSYETARSKFQYDYGLVNAHSPERNGCALNSINIHSSYSKPPRPSLSRSRPLSIVSVDSLKMAMGEIDGRVDHMRQNARNLSRQLSRKSSHPENAAVPCCRRLKRHCAIFLFTALIAIGSISLICYSSGKIGSEMCKHFGRNSTNEKALARREQAPQEEDSVCASFRSIRCPANVRQRSNLLTGRLECCADTKKQLFLIFQTMLEEKLQHSVGDFDQPTPYAAHLKLESSRSEKSQKPFEVTSIREWAADVNFSFLREGFLFNRTSGCLQVQKRGLYYVYSQLSFLPNNNQPDIVMIHHLKKGNQVIFKDSQSNQLECKEDRNTACWTSSLSGLVNLQPKDSICVATLTSSLLLQDQTYFGGYRVAS